MNTVRLNRPFMLGLACMLLAWLGYGNLRAEDKKQTPEQREAAEAEAEEKDEIATQGEQAKRIFEGRLSVDAIEEGKEPPSVVGSFTSEGKTYALKITSPDLYAQLKKFDGKQVTLIGRPRNQEKYFVANGIQLPAAKPVYSRPRGSL